MDNIQINGKVTNRANIFSFYAVCSFRQSTEENATYITVKTYFKTTSTAYKFDTVSERAASITIGSKKTTISKRIDCNPWSSNPYLIQTVKDVKIPHAEDGTASVTISATADGTASSYGTSSSSSKPCTLSQTVTLTRIDRGIILLSAPNFKDTENPEIIYNNPIGTAVTSAEACISFDGENPDIAYRSIDVNGDNYTFELTEEERAVLRQGVTSSSKGNLYFVIKSSANGQTVKSVLLRSLEIVESAETKPSLSFICLPSNPSGLELVYAQGISKANVSVTANATFGASVVSYSTSVDGKKYTEKSFVSDVLYSPGKQPITVEVTDSRGFTAVSSQNIEVLEYSKPLVTNISGAVSVMCFRGNEKGEDSPESTKIYIKAKRQFSPLKQGATDKNSCVLRFRYKKTADEYFGDWKILLSSADTSDEFSGLAEGTFPVSDSFNVEIGVSDTVGGFSSLTFVIPEGSVTLHLKKGGKAVGVGKYADEDESFAVKWKTIFDEGIVGTALFTQAEDIFSFAESCSAGISPFVTAETSSNLPAKGNYITSPGIVFKLGQSDGIVYLFDYIDGSVAVCNYSQGVWGEWRYIKTSMTI